MSTECSRISVLHKVIDQIGTSPRLFVYVEIHRINNHGKQWTKDVLPVAHLNIHLHRTFGEGDAHSPIERPPYTLQRRIGGPVLAEHGVKAPAVDKTMGRGVIHLDSVPAVIEGIEEPASAFGPHAFPVQPVQRDHFLVRIADLIEIDPQSRLFEKLVKTDRLLGDARQGHAEKTADCSENVHLHLPVNVVDKDRR